MNDDDSLDHKDWIGQAAPSHSAVTPYDFADIPDLNFTDDPWANSNDLAPDTLPLEDIWDNQHSRNDAQNTTHAKQKDIDALHHNEERAALPPLPYGLTQVELDSKLVQALEVLEPVDRKSDAKEAPSDVIGPMDIVSTRTVWDTLRTVKNKRVTFVRSNIEREMLAILQAWQTRAKNQPSWTRPVSLQTKKNRESIGPALFGWGRTDVPAWIEPPRTPRTPQPSQLSHVQQFAPERTPETEDESVEFGEFESAPPSAILQSPDNHFANDALIQDPSKHNSLKADTDSGVRGLGIFDLGDFPPSSPEKKMNAKESENPIRQASEPARSRESDDQIGIMEISPLPYTAASNAVVTATAAAASEAGSITEVKSSNSADVWDLSIFEKQLLKQIPIVASPVATSIDTSAVVPTLTTASIGSKTDGHARQPSLSDTRASKEAADQRTVERITLLLPDIDYLLN